MLTARQIKKLAKAKTDREIIGASAQHPGAGAGLWHDGIGTIIFAEEPDEKLKEWATRKGHKFEDATSRAVDYFRNAETTCTKEIYPVEIVGYTDTAGLKTAQAYIRFVDADGREEWAKADYVAAVLKRGAQQFFQSSERAILAKNGHAVALFMPCELRKLSTPGWRLSNTELPI